MLAIRNLLKINTDDLEKQRTGSLLQGLVIAIVGVSLLLSLFEIARFNDPLSRIALFRSAGSLTFGVICLLLIRAGRIRVAAHFFFGMLSLTFFVLLLTTTRTLFFPYLMLISIVAIASVDSIRASVVYGALTLAGVSAFFILSDMFTLQDVGAYVVTCLSISVVAWTVAEFSQKALQDSEALASELTNQSNLLQQRAKQLQFSAEIAEKGSSSLDLTQLLQETVVLLKSQFELYHVSIFLASQTDKKLELREVASDEQIDLLEIQYVLPIDNQSIVGWAALHREPRVVDDVQRDNVYQEEPYLPKTRSELALPLVARNELLGVLDVQSDQAEAFGKEDIATLQIVANQIAINIDNARLFAKTESRLNETRILYEYNSLLSSTLDVGELHRRAARALSTWLNASRCAIFSWDRAEQTVTVQVDFAYDLASGAIDQFMLDLPTFALGNYHGIRHMLESGEPKVWQRTDKELDIVERQHLQNYGQQSYLDVPLMRGANKLGFIRLYRNKAETIFTEAEIQLAQAMANETAVSIANATLTSESQARVAQLSSLNRLSLALSEAPNLEEVYKATRREVLSLVEATGLAISLLTEDEEHLSLLYLYDYGKEIDLSSMSPISTAVGFMGHVARTRSTLHLHGTPENQETYNSFQIDKTADFHEYWLGIPLIVTSRLIGVFSLQNLEPFSEHDIQQLTTIAGAIAISINNLLQLETVQKALSVQFEQRVQMQTAAEIAASATSSLGLESLAQQAVDLIKERFELYYVGLFLVEDEFAVLKAGTGEAGEAQLAAKRQLKVGGQSLIGGATVDGKPRITQDVEADKEWLPNPHLPETRSELALPLQVQNKIIGALTVQSAQPELFSEDLLNALQIMADQLAVAIQNAQLLSKAQAQAERQQYLNEISTQLHQSADVETIVGIGLRALSKQLNGTAVELQLGRPKQTS